MRRLAALVLVVVGLGACSAPRGTTEIYYDKDGLRVTCRSGVANPDAADLCQGLVPR